jgi:HSP20 family protein
VLTVDGRISLDGYANLAPVYTEQGLGHFRRSFQLGAAVESEKIDAQLRDGVLQLVLPKRQAARSRRIEVAAA